MAVRRELQWVLDDSAGSTVLRVRGEIDAGTSPEFGRAVREALARGKATVIDLSAVVHIDEHGINVLREHANLTRASIRPSAQLRRSLETMGIAYLFRFR